MVGMFVAESENPCKIVMRAKKGEPPPFGSHDDD